jgi:tetratricopeptide (TPR) repeat protein
VGAAYWSFYHPESEPDAAKVLLEIDSDLAGQRWAKALTKASYLSSKAGVSPTLRGEATTRQAKASAEILVEQTYGRFLGSGENYDLAVNLYLEIPASSSYHQSARQIYDRIFPLFVAKHLNAAEDARALGQCEKFHNEVNAVLDMDPKDFQALKAQDRPCGERSSGPEMTRTTPIRHSPSRKPNELLGLKLPTRSPPAEMEAPNDEEAKETLNIAQTQLVNGKFRLAIRLAKTVQAINPTRAWLIIGTAACSDKDMKLADEAYNQMDEAGRGYLSSHCQRLGITHSKGPNFSLDETYSESSQTEHLEVSGGKSEPP